MRRLTLTILFPLRLFLILVALASIAAANSVSSKSTVNSVSSKPVVNSITSKSTVNSLSSQSKPAVTRIKQAEKQPASLMTEGKRYLAGAAGMTAGFAAGSLRSIANTIDIAYNRPQKDSYPVSARLWDLAKQTANPFKAAYYGSRMAYRFPEIWEMHRFLSRTNELIAYPKFMIPESKLPSHIQRTGDLRKGHVVTDDMRREALSILNLEPGAGLGQIRQAIQETRNRQLRILSEISPSLPPQLVSLMKKDFNELFRILSQILLEHDVGSRLIQTKSENGLFQLIKY